VVASVRDVAALFCHFRDASLKPGGSLHLYADAAPACRRDALQLHGHAAESSRETEATSRLMEAKPYLFDAKVCRDLAVPTLSLERGDFSSHVPNQRH
jgi:hypothetical protein